MEKRILGKTELKVGVVGCGGIPVQRVSQEEVNEIVDELIKNNINFIDSARGYTDSEVKFGIALKGKRDKFFLATKSMSRDYEGMKRDVNLSLANFQTDHIDLYQIHNLQPNQDYFGALKALLEAKEEGKVLHIGVTSHNAEFLYELLDKEDHFETVQFPYNFLESQGEKLFKKAHDMGLGTIVMKPLAGGNIDEPLTSFKYILANENITVVIPGMESTSQVKINASVESYELNKDELEYIEKTRLELGHNFCHRCGYCKPCTKGIDIPSCFMFENYYKRYNLKEWASDRYNSMKVKASECIKCGKCETRCPYELHIIEKLAGVAKLFEENNEEK